MKAILSAAMLLLGASAASAATVFAPGSTVIGGERQGTDFVVGQTAPGTASNDWPGAEGPQHAIDGVGQKYLNFAKEDSGFLVVGSEAFVVTSAQFWTANDFAERDPGSYEIWGSNAASFGSTPGTGIAMSGFSLVSSGLLSLPGTRNGSGSTALDAAASQTVTFSNTAAYSSYLILFPTLKNSGAANSVQIGEVQLYGEVVAPVPLPAALPLLAVGLGALGARRRRNG